MTPFDLPANYLDLFCYDAHHAAQVRAAYVSQPLDDIDHEHHHVPEQRGDVSLTPNTGELNITGQEPIVVTEAVQVALM